MYDLLFPDAISYYNVHVNFMLYFASQVSRPHSRHLYRASIFVGTALLLDCLKYLLSFSFLESTEFLKAGSMPMLRHTASLAWLSPLYSSLFMLHCYCYLLHTWQPSISLQIDGINFVCSDN